MAITEPYPGLPDLFYVDANIELFDELQALLLDHLLDHISLLANLSVGEAISDCGVIPGTTTIDQLAA